MPEFIRVRARDTGYEMTIRTIRFDPEIYTKAKGPALDAHGEPAPVNYRTPAAKPAEEKKAGPTAAESEKEN